MTGKGSKLLVNDTIWFIRDLPPDLIDAFKSTLEDSVTADLLLHVVDITDPLVEDKIAVVNEILDAIWAEQPRRLIANKVDLLSEEALLEVQHARSEEVDSRISTYSGYGLDKLKSLLIEQFGLAS